MPDPARIYIVRHASPRVDPQAPSPTWELSERGRDEARRLGENARAWGLRAIYTSTEPKAVATAVAIGDATGAPVRKTAGLEELRMPEWVGNADEFAELVRSIFEHADVSVRGAERAETAAARFAAAIEMALASELPAAVVSHGRIISAWLAHAGAVDDTFALWRSLPMPGWAAVHIRGGRSTLADEFAGLSAPA